MQGGSRIYFDDQPGKPIAVEALARAIRERLEEEKMSPSRVLLKSDPGVAYGRVADLIRQVRVAGIDRVGLVTSLLYR